MAGWRIGFLAGHAELVGRVRDLVDHVTAGVYTGLQRGLEAALTGDQSDVAQRRAVYEARRDRLVAKLRAAGAEIASPEGTFYAWWRLPEGVTIARLIEEARVGLAPGEGFGARGEGWARLSLAVPDEDVDEAANRLAGALATSSGR
jgi:aminotransferase